MDVYKEALRRVRKWVRDGDPTARKLIHISKLVEKAYGEANDELHQLSPDTNQDALRFVHNLVTSILLHWMEQTSTPLCGNVTLSDATKVFFPSCAAVTIRGHDKKIDLWKTRTDYTEYYDFTTDIAKRMLLLSRSTSEPTFALDHVLSNPLPKSSGLVLEFGVAAGKSLRKIRNALMPISEHDSRISENGNCLGGQLYRATAAGNGDDCVAVPNSTLSGTTPFAAERHQCTAAEDYCIVGFDSFEGLPSAWRCGFGVGRFSQHGVVPEDLRLANDAAEYPLHIVVGWFDDTLPTFIQDPVYRTRLDTDGIALVHIDCDIYASTKMVLETLAPWLNSDTVIVFDELVHYGGFELHELRAWYEYIRGCSCNMDVPVSYEFVHAQKGMSVGVRLR
eukprot:m.31185 g.31185  ORF g.31185 m.31185 type:complete len:393 (-) comp13956_c0_seq3:282-1460(-)